MNKKITVRKINIVVLTLKITNSNVHYIDSKNLRRYGTRVGSCFFLIE